MTSSFWIKESQTFLNVTDDNYSRIALAMYLGDRCKYCGRIYETLDDLADVVWAGDSEHGAIACEACWKANNPDVTESNKS